MLPTIDLSTYPEHAEFIRRSQKGRAPVACWLCGRGVNDANHNRLVVEAGTFEILDPASWTPAEVQDMVDGGSLWTQAIGNECLRKHPELKPYLHIS
jgi:hypothetical protein